jgi:hypothetical protein
MGRKHRRLLMRRSWRHSLVAATFVATLLSVTGCGNVDDTVAPDGSKLTVDPAAFTRTLGAPTCSVYEEGPVLRVTVRNADGKPLNDIEVSISRSNPNVAFYNPDGVTGDPTVSTIRRVTNDYGYLEFKIAVFDCAGVTVVVAASGTATAKVDVTVN